MPTVGKPGSSTIAQPVGSQSAPSVQTRSGLAIRQVFFTAKELATPETLYRVIHDLQVNIVNALRSIGQDPTLSKNVLSGVVFTTGQTRVLSHGLGRAYSGWYCVRAQGLPGVFVEAVLPPGTTAAQVVALTSTNAGTYSIALY